MGTPNETPAQPVSCKPWFGALRSIVAKYPELREMQNAEVVVVCSPSRPEDEIGIEVRWWQCGGWQKTSIIYPEPDWVDGLDGLVKDAVERAAGNWRLFKRNTGEAVKGGETSKRKLSKREARRIAFAGWEGVVGEARRTKKGKAPNDPKLSEPAGGNAP